MCENSLKILRGSLAEYWFQFPEEWYSAAPRIEGLTWIPLDIEGEKPA